jgi:hypothetical protein
VTLADLLGSVPVAPDDSMTAQELAKATGRRKRYVEKWLEDALADGRAEFAGYKTTLTVTGAERQVRAYRVKQ